MKTIKIEYRVPSNKSIWKFETKDIKKSIRLCENGISQQYIVLVNGKKYRSMRSFGKTINLNTA